MGFKSALMQTHGKGLIQGQLSTVGQNLCAFTWAATASWSNHCGCNEKITAAACGKAEHDVKPRLERSSPAHNLIAHTCSGCG